ncbi:hypothetical protein J6590_050301 [Homalodisca vitripennis]|nr:hypothetical protein J6590_050301 [Homalodisca vitripennis]
MRQRLRELEATSEGPGCFERLRKDSLRERGIKYVAHWSGQDASVIFKYTWWNLVRSPAVFVIKVPKLLYFL